MHGLKIEMSEVANLLYKEQEKNRILIRALQKIMVSIQDAQNLPKDRFALWDKMCSTFEKEITSTLKQIS